MKTKRVYLAGHFNNLWEQKALELLHNNDIAVYNARNSLLDKYFNAQTSDEIARMKYDITTQNLNYLKYCDVILINLADIVTCFDVITELAYAYKEKKIIVAFGNTYDRTDVLRLCSHVADTLADALEYINWYIN